MAAALVVGSGEPSAVSDRRPEEPSAVATAPSEMAWPSVAIAVVAIAVARPVAAAVVAAVVAALAVAAFAAAAATTSWPAGQSTYVFFYTLTRSVSSTTVSVSPFLNFS